MEAQAVSSEIHNNHSPVLTEPMAAWNAADSQCSTSPQCNVDVPQTQVQCKAKDGNSSDLEAFKHIVSLCTFKYIRTICSEFLLLLLLVFVLMLNV